ncbi:hypothetical protein [Streptomyces sp. NPDC048436]|uniref:hypothetical protein n=1 Tax=Streptomyces sp. NPDC048436 TaxID=3365550 RepID=UPI0037133890
MPRPHWEFTRDGDHLIIEHPQRGTPYRPPRLAARWPDLLTALACAFADLGVPRAHCLPLHWGRETELTISAVQALDPYLKQHAPAPYRQGYLPQPVVRLTGKRDAHGNLHDGFPTSFVNTSRVHPITELTAYGTVLDEWLTALSRMGFHARHLKIHGSLRTWSRRQVSGITLRYDHAGLPLGDLVLLWNTEDPTHLAVDLGTSLERLTWARSRLPWRNLIHGPLANAAPPDVLDAIRTATLLLGHGITPSARGAGNITRRVAAPIPHTTAALGLSAAVRAYYAYWAGLSPLATPWGDVSTQLEREVTARGHAPLR